MESQKNLKVYKSSAGSGKTFTLVKEYLRLALMHPSNYRHILAITFTVKAAAEMKERIISYCKKISEEDMSDGGTEVMLDKLIEESGLSREEVVHGCATLLGNILHNYSDFAVSTIDSFVYRIIKSFAHDLQLSLDFNIDMDTEAMIGQAVDILISRIREGEDALSAMMVEFVETQADEEAGTDVEKPLSTLSKQLVEDEAQSHLEELAKVSLAEFSAIRKKMIAKRKWMEAHVKELADKAMELISEKGLQESDFYYGRSGIHAYFRKRTIDYDTKIFGEANTYIGKSIDEDKWLSGPAKKSSTITADIESIQAELKAIGSQIVDFEQDNKSDYFLINMILKDFYALALLSEMEKVYKEYKERNEVIHISDQHRMIYAITSELEAPYIYERIGEKFRHFLLDEFQDTSIIQWHNLVPLVENALSEGYYNLIVGDSKQAIYRWRGGEVMQFSELPKIYGAASNPVLAQRGLAFHNNYDGDVLKENYRSRAEIINFNNEFFKSIYEKDAFTHRTIYKDHQQGKLAAKPGGYVSLILKETEEKKRLKIEEFLEDVNRSVLDAERRGFEWRDIAILTRTNKEGSEIARYLLSNKVDVISSESLLLSNSTEVKKIIGLLKCLRGNGNLLARADFLMLFAPKIRMEKGDDAFHALLAGKHRDAGKRADENVRKYQKYSYQIEDLFQDIEDYCGVLLDNDKIRGRSLYELNVYLSRQFLSDNKRDPFIQFYLDRVFSYSLRYSNNLNDFLLWWERKKDNISIVFPDTMNAVRIMTIHKAKGLEFPVVILPAMNWRMKKGKKKQWLHIEKEYLEPINTAFLPISNDLAETEYSELVETEEALTELDHINLMYVALTRPREVLYLLSQGLKKDRDRLISEFVIDFAEKMIKDPDIPDHYFFGDQQYVHAGDTAKNEKMYHGKVQKQDVESKKEKGPQDMKAEAFERQDSFGSVRIKRNAALLWSDEKMGKIERGKLIHGCFEKIRTKADVSGAVASLQYGGILTEEEAHKMEEEIRNLLANPLLKPLFQAGLRIVNELPIAPGKGATRIPDRVIIDESTHKAVIVDYKTGAEEAKHKAQVKEYAHLLEELGYAVDYSLLVYFDSGEILKVQ